jgi:hypothetical protein
MKTGLAVMLVAVLGASAGAGPALPGRLSDTGLYLPGTRSVDPRHRAFSPQYPLWTDGATKERWVQLPPNGRIDASDPERWAFPVGTRFWKEFSFAGRKVETRLIWRSGVDSWSFASYVWNEAQTEATLAPPAGVPAAAEIEPGKWHDVPSRGDCRACHDGGTAIALGFSALQLSDDRDPAAPHAEPLQPGMLTLRTLVDEGVLSPVHPDLLVRSPRIPGDPHTRAALGYLSANCGHCHHERSSVATVRYPLLMPAYATADQVTAIVETLRTRAAKWDVPHTAPGTSSLLAPGAPDRSALFVRMRSRRPSSQMPPLGTVVADRVALELVRTWIAQMHQEPR